MFNEVQSSEHEYLDAFSSNYPNVTHAKIKDVDFSSKTSCQFTRNSGFIDSAYWSQYDSILSRMSEEEREVAIKDIEIMKSSTELNHIKSNDVIDYWNSIKDLEVRLRNTSDKELSNMIANDNFSALTRGGGSVNPDDLTNSNPASYYIIPKYNSDNLKNTTWIGACGPGIVAWAYRGLFAYYPYNNSDNYIPIYGDTNRDNFLNRFSSATKHYYAYYDVYTSGAHADHGVYKNVDARTGPSGELYHLGLANAIKDLTGKQYQIVTTAYSHKNIKNGEPVFIMAVMYGRPHYFLAFGYGETKVGSNTTKYIYIKDNGSMTEYNSTKYFYPYWRKETSNYGLRYKIAKL